jgi:hypothetical protein
VNSEIETYTYLTDRQSIENFRSAWCGMGLATGVMFQFEQGEHFILTKIRDQLVRKRNK